MLNQPTEEQLQTHMRYLSSDVLEGRAPGTRGEALTSSYISSHFRAAGLHPLPYFDQSSPTVDPFVQNVPMIGVTVQNTSDMIISLGNESYAYTNSDFTIDSETGSTYPLYYLVTILLLLIPTRSIDFSNASMAFVGHCVNIREGSNAFDPNTILICLTTPMSNNSAEYPKKN